MSWMKNLKNHSFWSVVISYSVQQDKPFLDQTVTCDRKWILYDNWWWWPTQWLDQEDAPKHFPRPNLPPKNVMVTVWWSAACLIHCSFLNPSETVTSEKYAQQIDEIHPKLQSLQLTLVNGRGQFFSLTTLDLMNFTMFTWPLFNQPPFLQASQQLFEGKMRPQPIGGIKFFQEFTESQNMDFYAIWINKLIFCGQKCVDCNGFYCDY